MVGIGALQIGIGLGRQRVLPAELVPIGDRPADRDTSGSRANLASTASAGGQEEQPWLVNNSTATGCAAGAAPPDELPAAVSAASEASRATASFMRRSLNDRLKIYLSGCLVDEQHQPGR